MEDDDDLPRPSEEFRPKNLDAMSLEQLRHYITVLAKEIERVELEITSKSNAMEAAESFFKN